MSPVHTNAVRRRVAIGTLALWGLVCVARLTRLIEPSEVPTGEEVAAFVPFAAQTIPSTAGFLYVQPTEFGADSGVGPRLRYELYPRHYEDIRASEDEATARQLMARLGLGYVVVPQAGLLPPTHWARQPVDLQRIDFGPDAYILTPR